MGLADRDYMKRQGTNDPYYESLFEPRSEPRATTNRTTPWWLIGALTLFGLFVLPYIAIGGHHYRFWLF